MFGLCVACGVLLSTGYFHRCMCAVLMCDGVGGGWVVDFLLFFNATATTEIYTLSLPDALPFLLLRGVGGGE